MACDEDGSLLIFSSAPPAESQAEAPNFPNQTYEFSGSKELFQAPPSYPEPPKDMWYEVPKEKPAPQEPPTPIFPWERDHPPAKPTRVFAEDLLSEPTPATQAVPTSESNGREQSTAEPTHHPEQYVPAPAVGDVQGENAGTDEKDQALSPESKSGTDERTVSPPGTFSPPNFEPGTNAWDNVPGIERYVRAVMNVQQPRPKKPATELSRSLEELLSPTGESGGRQRRESLKITDFPSAIERPSLPVTPAPMRRPSFWGEERDEAGDLPGAEGVPDQANWVCPRCGFSSASYQSFLRLPSHLQPKRHSPPTATSTTIAMPESFVVHRLSSSDASAFSGSTILAPSSSPPAIQTTTGKLKEDATSSANV